MTAEREPDTASIPADKPPSLEKALEKSQDVEQKMERCANELSSVNETVKKEMIAGGKSSHVEKTLAQSESLEDRVQECAGELHEVNAVLAQEIDDRNRINRELVNTLQKLFGRHRVLSDTQDILAVAQEAVEEAEQRTLHDPATGIPNRQLFDDHLEKAIAFAERCGWALAVMFIDLDRFKQINDTHGHAIGDKVLRTVAHRLHEQVRSADTVCRYGGDEFLYLLVNPQNTENIEHIARKVYDRISKNLVIDDLVLTVEPSIGIAVYPDDGSSGRELVENADTAMYHAKRTKTRLVFFDSVSDRSGKARTPNPGQS